MNKKSNYKLLLILLVILLALLLRPNIKDAYSALFNIFNKDNKIVYSDNLVNNYIDTLENDITEYKEITKLNDCVYSYVTYRNPSIWYDEFMINKGKREVSKGNIVINNEGLVGVVKEVYNNTSLVSLITNSKSNNKITVGLKMEDRTIYGIISKFDKIKNELVISELTEDINNYYDSDIITTSFTNTFKEGIVIGKVKRIARSENRLYNIAYATPNVKYNDIKYVCVLK